MWRNFSRLLGPLAEQEDPKSDPTTVEALLFKRELVQGQKLSLKTMRCNDKELSHVAQKPCTHEGRMSFKPVLITKNSYEEPKERFFRLTGNILFYYRYSSLFGGIIEKTPMGALLLEHCEASPHCDTIFPFSFILKFKLEPDRQYVFGCANMQSVDRWVNFLNSSTYDNLRNKYNLLKNHVQDKTGVQARLGIMRPVPALVSRSDGPSKFVSYVDLIEL